MLWITKHLKKHKKIPGGSLKPPENQSEYVSLWLRRVDKNFSLEVLNGSIVSKATADTLTRALKMVTLEGTATRLKNAKCVVAGKTGTAWTVLRPDEKPQKGKPFESINGEKKYQATFVGFFPADEPKYSAIVVVYTKLTRGSVYGGTIPALTFKEIVDNAIDEFTMGYGKSIRITF